jgi:hypothetical protein
MSAHERCISLCVPRGVVWNHCALRCPGAVLGSALDGRWERNGGRGRDGTGREHTDKHAHHREQEGRDRESGGGTVGGPSRKAVDESAVPGTDCQPRSSTDATPAQRCQHSSSS